MLFFSISIGLFLVIILVNNKSLKKHSQALQQLPQNRRRNYYILYLATFFLCISPIVILTLFIILIIHSITKDPSIIDYVFYFLPNTLVILLAISIVIIIWQFSTLKPGMYIAKQKRANISHVIIGFISLIWLFIIIPFLNELIKLTFSSVYQFPGIVEWLNAPTFHPIQLIHGILFIGPSLILLIGVLNALEEQRYSNHL